MSTELYTRVSALLTDQQIERLKQYARSKGVGMATVIRWAVDDFTPPLFLDSGSLECNVHSDEPPVDIEPEVLAS